jgi:hypothetical protein
MKITLYTILKQISELETEDAIIDGLRKSNPVVRQLLQYAFHPGIKFMLPSGTPPYKPCEFLDLEGRLLSEMRKLYLFVEGGNPNLSKVKREMLFIQLLESIDKNDAVLLCHIKDKKLPFKKISAKIAKKAFPDDYPEEQET